MAEGTVDNLNIQLSADADQAVKSLNNLASTLRSINTAFTKDISGMRKFSKEIGTLSASMQSLSKIKFSAPDMSGMNKMLKSLNGMDASGAKKIADGIEKVVNSFNKLGNANFNDSGINKTVNALNRLFKVDTSKFNPNDFVRITDSISKLGNMPDVSSGVNRFVSSLSRLANAGEKTGQSANNILRLGEQTRQAAQRLQSVGAINDDVNLFVQSIGRLASAGNKTSQTASGLSTLADETLKFFQAMQNAPKISQNTIAMTQALAQLATAGGKVGTSTNTVTSAFNKLASVGNKTLSAMKKVANGIVSAFQRIGNSSGGLTKAQFSLSNLLKTAVGFRLGYGLLNFGKQAFQLGSDITEVENVVDVAFGSMAQSAYDFASTAQEQFGLSELMALRYSGTMMSVLNASGVAQRDAAEMSTTLTGLSGDLASFYNISQDNAWEKIMSGMAGEIEPLRRLGINMSVANLEAFALSQGITKSWQSMTQAEQVMLRYNYLMQASAQQQGDFARTSWSWANQVRLLTLNIQQLAATIGQGLIAAVLPAVTALNKLFAVLQKAAVAVRNFFYVLTGYEGGGSSGIVNDLASIGDASTGLEDLGSAGTDAAGGLGDAAKAAEDLKNATLGIDELNIISPNEPTSTGGSGGSGGGGGTGGAGGSDLGLDDGLLDLGGKDPEKYVSPWAERIRAAFLAEDWEQLGFEIADGLNRGLQKVYDVISWDNVGPKITAFTTAFTQTFNSLVDNFDWDLLGRTIGAGINTAVNTVNQLIGEGGINFKAIGSKLSVGLRGAVNEIEWEYLGNMLGNGFMISWNLLDGFVLDMSKKNGAGITGWEELGSSIGEALKGVFEKIDFGTIADVFVLGFNGIFDFLKGFNAEKPFEGLGTKISTALNTIIRKLDPVAAGTAISDFVTGLLGEFVIIAEQTDWSEFGRKIGELLENIDWGTILTQIGTILSEVFGGLIDGLSETTVGKVVLFIAQLALAFKGKSILNSVDELTGGIGGKFSGLSSIFGSSSKQATDAATTLGTATSTSGGFLDLFGGKLKGLAGKFANSAVATGGFTALLESMNNQSKATAGNGMTALLTTLDKLKDQGEITDDQFNDMYSTLTAAQLKGIEFEDSMSYVRDSLDKAGVSSEEFEETLSNTLDDLGESSKNKAKIIGAGIADGTKEGMEEKADEVREKTEGIGGKIIKWFKDLLGIHSPSTVFEEIGRNTLLGFNNGLDGESVGTLSKISTFASDILSNIDVSDEIYGFFSNALTNIEKDYSEVPDWFGTTFTNAYDNVTSSWQFANTWFGDKWKSIKKVFDPTAQTFKTWFSNAYSGVQGIWKPVNSWFQGKWSEVKTVFNPTASTFKGWFLNAYNNVKNVWNAVNSWFQGKWNSVKNVFSDVQSFFKSGFQNAYNSVKNIWSGIGNYFKKIANNIINPIEKAVNGIISGINWVLKKVGSKTRVSSWNAPNFAKGSNGIEKDTLGVVNDQKGATYKELIVPPNGRAFIPKGRNVMLPLTKGTKIMPAKQTKELMKSMGIPHFAGGIGDFISGAWNAVKDFTGDVFDYLTNPGDIIKIALDKFMNLSNIVEPWLSVAGGIANTVFGSIKDFISNIFEKIVPKVDYNPSSGVEQWRSLAKYALQLEGQYTEANLDRLLMQMSTESSGNPNAINNWDINAKNGTPSKGLMQVIDPTFRAYARPGYSSNIYDPLSNILASIRYTISRYGSLSRGWQGHGYASGIGTITMADLFGAIPKLAGGGVIMPGQLFVANERGPEIVGRYGNRTTVVNNDQVVSSVSSGVEKAVQRQNAEMTLLLRQILETNQQILAKDNSVNLDGKRTNKLLDRAKSNAGYGFRRTVTAT